MDECWLSQKQVAELENLTERAIRKRIRSDHYKIMRPVPSPNGGGKNGMITQIALSCLDIPPDVKAGYLKKEKPLMLPVTEHANSREKTIIPDESREVGLTPKDLQDPKIARKIKVGLYINTLPRYSGRDSAVKDFAGIYGVHPSTVWRWVDWAGKKNRDARPCVSTDMDPEHILPKSNAFDAVALAFGMAVYAGNLHCGKKAAFKALTRKAEQSGWKLGDYSNFTRLIKKVPADVWTRIVKGDLGFELECVPKIIRNWLSVPAQSVICGDQKIFDYEVYDPETDTIITPNGYFWMDCASRMINGVWIELGPYNSFTVGHSLREALRYGIPDEIFTDWGKPEGANHITHIRESIRQFCYTGDYNTFADKYYIDHKRAQPQKPWQKPIENIMNQIDLIMKEHFPPGYRKRNHDAWKNNEIQKTLKKERKTGGLMTVEEFIDLVFKVVNEHNNRIKKLTEGKKIVPADVLKEGLEAQARVRMSDETLDYICFPVYTRVPRQAKVGVRVKKDDYREFFSFKINGLDRVQISIDPYDKEAPAMLTDLEGNFIDLGEPIPRGIPGESSDEVTRFMEVRARYMKEVRKKARQLKDAFGLVSRQEIIAIGTASHTARKVRKETELRDDIQVHQQREARLINLEAKKARKELMAEMAAEKEEVLPEGFTIPEDGRDRYKTWKGLEELRQIRELSHEEHAFWKHFQATADYRAYKAMEEDFGDAYMVRGGD